MIPVSEPSLGPEEAANVAECVATGWVSSSGRFIDAFERDWAAYCRRGFGIAVANGTTALQVAVGLLDLQPGDEVILPTFTIVSCVLPIVEAGAVPILVDSDPRTWTMDVRQLAERITPRTRAVMPVHIYGHPVDMDPVLSLAEENGLAVIEDAAEAHGALYLRHRDTADAAWEICGSFGAASCFSFYANKLVTTGEGGMVLVDDPLLAERARGLRNLCFRAERRFYHTDLGYNFRMTNMQAALGVAQVPRMEQIVSQKRWMAQAYAERLASIPGLQLPVEEPWARNVWWMYGVVLDDALPLDAEAFGRALRDRGIETRPFFLGMHEQPVLQERGLFRGETHPVAERLARRGLYLPSGLTLTEEQIDTVCEAVREVLA